ncbi:peptidoglycan DD-metalloendopeptidase family protein [Microbacterium invictum]|uniref:Peptidoglycan DD-metalloendopeptidase family protein n=1 Tax=Microbacterium invictum TaxID=515415 RepID=A0ABZ0VD88_9MICO|nr:peptidoglycan DD-metalloendopeptidase family protein [Microbacterium invictum]WQB71346.1 peptidoglycan DD-metalloendopeptidase family protein [Microbacterium invictum]
MSRRALRARAAAQPFLVNPDFSAGAAPVARSASTTRDAADAASPASSVTATPAESAPVAQASVTEVPEASAAESSTDADAADPEHPETVATSTAGTGVIFLDAPTTTGPFRLLEPPMGHSVADEDPAANESDAPHTAPRTDDEFEAAARLFCFTGETPVQNVTAEESFEGGDPAPATPDIAAHVAAARRRRPGRGAAFRRAATASFSVSVMGIVGLLAVATTTPAEAVAAATGTEPAAVSTMAPGTTDLSVDPDEIQAYVAPATTENAQIARGESYETVTMADLAAASGITNFSNFYVNDPTAAIQWPFAVGVSISYGFGMRSGKMHEGLDFVPGAGAPIQAIADGTVRIASESGGAYGVHVIIDHVIDGQLISSHYAHMEYDSLQVVPGQQVTVGTVLGRTGNTGRSFGAHTHFELLMNGTTPIDPLPWLREHAGG